MAAQTHKLILIGDGMAGKTTPFNQLYTREFQTRYIPSIEMNIFTLSFHTNKGNIVFNIYDFTQHKMPKDQLKIINKHKITYKNHIKYIDILKDYICIDLVNLTLSYCHDIEHISDAACVIVISNILYTHSYGYILNWVSFIRKKIPKIPIIVCGENKHEDQRIVYYDDDNNIFSKKRKVSLKNITKHRELGLFEFYDVLTNPNYNFEKLFLTLARHFHGRDTKIIAL